MPRAVRRQERKRNRRSGGNPLKRSLVFALAVLLFPAIHAFGAQCPPFGAFYDTRGAVCGRVFKVASNGTRQIDTQYEVKFCSTDTRKDPWCGLPGRRTFTQWVSNPWPNAFTEEWYNTNFSGDYGPLEYEVYAWSYYDSSPFGSEWVPIRRVTINDMAAPGGYVELYLPPRPLSPSPVYPYDGASNVPDNMTVKWQSGKDAERTSYPTTYQIWFKYWPYGGTEPADFSLSASGMPCNPDGTGVCTTNVTGMSHGNWRWKVVADMDVSSVIPYYEPVRVFSTTSNVASFTVGLDYRPPGCCR